MLWKDREGAEWGGPRSLLAQLSVLFVLRAL